MANQATVTAKTMGAITVTGKVIPNVSKVEVDVANFMLRVYQGGSPNYQEYDISAATTLTCTISGAGGTYAWVVS